MLAIQTVNDASSCYYRVNILFPKGHTAIIMHNCIFFLIIVSLKWIFGVACGKRVKISGKINMFLLCKTKLSCTVISWMVWDHQKGELVIFHRPEKILAGSMIWYSVFCCCPDLLIYFYLN